MVYKLLVELQLCVHVMLQSSSETGLSDQGVVGPDKKATNSRLVEAVVEL